MHISRRWVPVLLLFGLCSSLASVELLEELGDSSVERASITKALKDGDRGFVYGLLNRKSRIENSDSKQHLNRALALAKLLRIAREEGSESLQEDLAFDALLSAEKVVPSNEAEDRVRALFIKAEIFEEHYRSTGKAREAFVQILKMDPSNEEAKRGKARQDLVDSVTAQREAEQLEILARRQK